MRDARYFHLKGLEQRLIPHDITYNLARARSEVAIATEYIRPSGLGFSSDAAPGSAPAAGWATYQRPFVDLEAYDLIIDISGEEASRLTLLPASAVITSRREVRFATATFYRQTSARIERLFTAIASKVGLPLLQSSDTSAAMVKVRIGPDADVTVDGRAWNTKSGSSSKEPTPSDGDDDESMGESSAATSTKPRRKRKNQRKGKQAVIRTRSAAKTPVSEEEDSNDDDETSEEWIIRKAQWRLRVQPVAAGNDGKESVEIILGAVKIDAYRTEWARNAQRKFLTE